MITFSTTYQPRLRARPTRRFRLAAIITISVFVLQSTFLPMLSVLVPGPSVRTAHAEEPDVALPTISLTAPTDGSTVSGSVSLTADASDNVGVAGVQFKLDGAPLGSELTTPPYQYNWDSTTATAAAHVLTVVARDAAGNSAESTAINVTVQYPPDKTGPIVTMTYPTEGATVSGNVLLAADATDNVGIATVRFKVDGAYFGSEITAPPYQLPWDTTQQSNGSHTLIVFASDAAGNTALSGSVHVVVDNSASPPPPSDVDITPPTVSLTSPVPGTRLGGIIPVTAEASDNVGVVGVQMKLDGAALGPEITTPPYRVDWDSIVVGNGSHTFSATARDAAGNIGESAFAAIEITNSNDATIYNILNTYANSGFNTSSGFLDSPTPVMIGTGAVAAGTVLSNEINKNVVTLNGQETTLPSDGPVVTPLQNVTVRNDNRATVINTVTSTAESGRNQANQNRFSDIQTGSANVYTGVVNTVNTNLTGTNFNAYIKDIPDTYVGNIDFMSMMLDIFSNTNSQTGSTNLEVRNRNQGSVTNELTINASTGSNQANDNRQARVQTGDINAATNVINLLNTNVVGSNWLFSVVNVFGNLKGDIILPGEGVLESLYETRPGTMTVEVDNTADVHNTVNVVGDTGQNSTINNRDGSLIQTGTARLRTAVSTTANQTIIGSNFYSFVPHIFGSWDGTVINSPAEGYFGRDARVDPDSTLTVDNVNAATINNRIVVDASSGRNDAEGNRYSQITTGDIQVATNLINVANTNIVGSNWFMGSFNMFGSWKGNVVYAYPDFSITSRVTGSARPGDLVEYTLSYENIGLAPGQNVTIRDVVPANSEVVAVSDGGQVQNGVVTWNAGLLAKGTTDRSVRFTVRVPDGLPIGTTNFTDAATISTSTPEEATTNNQSSATVSVTVAPPPPLPPPPPPAAPQLTIAKTNNAIGSKNPGDDVTYTVEVSNVGNVQLQNVVVHDVLPGPNGTTLFTKDFTAVVLDPDTTMEIVYTVKIGDATGDGTYTNTAVAQATYNGSTITSGQAQSSVVVKRAVTSNPPPSASNPPAVSDPSVSNPPVSSPAEWPPAIAVPAPKKNTKAELKVVQTHNAKSSLKPGAKIKFKIRISNTGGQTVKDIALSNTLKNGVKHVMKWKIGTLKPAEEVMLSFTFTLSKQAPSGKYTSTSVASGKQSNGKTVKSKNSVTYFRVLKQLVAGASTSKQTVGSAVSTSVVRGTKTRTATGGFYFKNDQGRAISAFKYASINSLRLVDLLSDSRDPVDQSFVSAYYTGLSLVGKRGKTGEIITLNDLIHDLRTASQFRSIYGT